MVTIAVIAIVVWLLICIFVFAKTGAEWSDAMSITGIRCLLAAIGFLTIVVLVLWPSWIGAHELPDHVRMVLGCALIGPAKEFLETFNDLRKRTKAEAPETK